VNKEALAHWGLSLQRTNKQTIKNKLAFFIPFLSPAGKENTLPLRHVRFLLKRV
jgi:hypothetical protein